MRGKSHRNTTTLALELMGKQEDHQLSFAGNADEIARMAVKFDAQKDMEMVKVKGYFRNPKDDPHHRSKLMPKQLHDVPSYSVDLKKDMPMLYWTSLNHYIDIGKGPGLFDDYDGYSFYNGSASKLRTEGGTVDTATAIYLDIRYLHAPGHPFYDNCSPAIERYSYYQDKGLYSSMEEEAQARYPLATGRPGKGVGFPYSVFSPVDNATRYWFDHYLESREDQSIAFCAHTIQDCTIPMHAAAVIGHHHYGYEKALDGNWTEWLADDDLHDHIIALYHEYKGHDDSPPTKLTQEDRDRTPAMNWSPDMLATWLAINSYQDFKNIYLPMKDDFEPDVDLQKERTAMAAAMTMMIMLKADTSAAPGS